MTLRKELKRLLNATRDGYANLFLRPRLFGLTSKERLGAVFLRPSDMVIPDRLMLYSLIRGLRPHRVLEIGIRYGGGARIIASALEDNGNGTAVGIDPYPEGFVVPERHLHGRYKRLTGYSPQDIGAAVEMLQGPPDFVLIDALHTGDAVFGDFKGVLPHLSDEAHVLFHDAYHQGISRAIEDVLAQNSQLHDLGFVTRHPDVHYPVSYQGLRLVRKGPVSSETLIASSYRNAGVKPPPFSDVLRNYDDYANGIGAGADMTEVAKLLERA